MAKHTERVIVLGKGKESTSDLQQLLKEKSPILQYYYWVKKKHSH